MPKRDCRSRCKVCGKHEIYCCGSEVHITNEGVKVLSEPMVEHCPLHESLYGEGMIDAEAVRGSVETKIHDFGFCCEDRSFDDDPRVAYGASEMITVWLEKGLVDCAVVVCEGAGTVITANGKLVQGIGARLTGIVKTSPIPKIMRHIERSSGTVLDKCGVSINQVAGVKKAFDMGFKTVAVTVPSFHAKEIGEIRRLEKTAKKDIVVFSVCNTRAEEKDVKHILKADIVCASASNILRKVVGVKAVLQAGVTIPVYALTQKGRSLILSYVDALPDKLVVFRTSRLPYEAERRGPRLKGVSADH